MQKLIHLFVHRLYISLLFCNTTGVFGLFLHPHLDRIIVLHLFARDVIHDVTDLLDARLFEVS